MVSAERPGIQQDELLDQRQVAERVGQQARRRRVVSADRNVRKLHDNFDPKTLSLILTANAGEKIQE